MKRLILTAALLLAAFSWGTTFVVVQDSVVGYSVFAFLTMRYGFASLAVLPFVARKIGKKELMIGAPVGLAIGFGMVLQTFGLRTTTATNSGFITGLYVVIAPLIAWQVYREKPLRRIWAAVALSVIGLGLIAGAHPGSLHIGDLLTLLAAACFAVQIVLLSRVSMNVNAMALTFVEMAVSLVVYVPPLVLSHAALLPPPRPEIWTGLLITGLLASAAGMSVQTYVQQRIPSGSAAVIMATEPVWAAVTGYLIAGDRLTHAQTAGALLMLLALFVAEVFPYLKIGLWQRAGSLMEALGAKE